HALRAFTPDDEKALKSAARTFPKTEFYSIEQILTTLGIGEALVTVLAGNGVPTPPVATRMIPPASRMGPLTELEFEQRLAASAQVKEYAQAVDRESARERLAQSMGSTESGPGPAAAEAARPSRPMAREAPGTFEQILRSPMARSVATTVTRGLLGALLGSPPRRRRRYF